MPNINTKEYWDEQWSVRGARVYPFYQHIANLCGDKKVLDFGCGRGDLLAHLQNGYGVDISSTAIGIVEARGMKGMVGAEVTGDYDIIVATELLEHVDDDKALIEHFFEHTDTIIFSVPNNCLSPEEEPEHVRTYTSESVKQLTPHIKRIWEHGNYLVVMASTVEQDLKPSVLCAVLSRDNLRPELVNSIAMMTHDPRYEIKVYYPNEMPIAQNRNSIVRKFLSGTWDYLLMIDSDNPPKRNPLDLVELDKDVIGLPTPQWNDSNGLNIYFVAMDRVEDGYREHADRKGLQEVDAVGTGCILIARRVLEKVKEPFMRKWQDGFQELGLDFYFCEKAKALGFSVWAHYEYICDHFKAVSLLKVLEFKHGR